MKFRIRKARKEDIEEILAVEEETWPQGLRATKEQFLSRIGTFSEGTLVVERNGIISGVVATEILDYDLSNPIPTWKEATDSGYIRKTHNPSGNTLYGVDLSVSRFANSAAKLLMLTVGKLIIRFKLNQGILGARVPRYHKFVSRLGIEEYVYGRQGNRPYDPELFFYTKLGLEIVGILPNYINDPESCNYGILLRWKNPFYGKPFPRFWSWTLPLLVKK